MSPSMLSNSCTPSASMRKTPTHWPTSGHSAARYVSMNSSESSRTLSVANETLLHSIRPSSAIAAAECSSIVLPEKKPRCSAACARLAGLLKRRPPAVTTESLPSTGRPAPSTESAFASASASATSPGRASCSCASSARSSIAAGRTSNSTPAAPSIVRREALLDASTIISAWFPLRMMVPAFRHAAS
jgi:hypothetical protein